MTEKNTSYASVPIVGVNVARDRIITILAEYLLTGTLLNQASTIANRGWTKTRLITSTVCICSTKLNMFTTMSVACSVRIMLGLVNLLHTDGRKQLCLQRKHYARLRSSTGSTKPQKRITCEL